MSVQVIELAEQIREKGQRSTAHNIDTLNPGFAGPRGKGRVNVQHALRSEN